MKDFIIGVIGVIVVILLLPIFLIGMLVLYGFAITALFVSTVFEYFEEKLKGEK